MSRGIIIDGHLDIAWNKQSLNRDFLLSAVKKANLDSEEIRLKEGIPTVGFNELMLSNIRIVCATIWVEPENSYSPSIGLKYHSIMEAKIQARQQLDYYYLLERNNEDIIIIKSKADIDKVLTLNIEYKLGIAIILEGADIIESTEDLNYWYEHGVRIIAPIWQKNKYGGCSFSSGGLTNEGKEIIDKMNNKRMILDIAHMSEQSAQESIDLYDHCVINSHTNCQTISPGERQISDRLIKAIHKKDGLVGLMMWNRTINPMLSSVTLDDYIEHVNHILNLTGCSKSVAIGSSMDGGFGAESLPIEMKNVGDLYLLKDKLTKIGLSDIDLENIMFKNWKRILYRSLFG